MNKQGKKNLYIQILTDKKSWVLSYAKRLVNILNSKQYRAELITYESRIKKGDILVILGWPKIIDKKILNLHKHNLVVHESDLPKGRGWSPLTWQILEGKNKIPITLFEADKGTDSGDIYFKDNMIFKGDELIDELRKKQGNETIKLVLRFLEKYPNLSANKQKGKPSYYRRRTPKNSEIDINKSIIEIFNQLRAADNERFPVFFRYKGNKYILKIFKEKNEKRK